MIRRIYQWFLLAAVNFALWLRYRVKVIGLNELEKELPPGRGGILFLPNHPTVFADPAILTTTILKRYPVRPVIVDYMYYATGVFYLMNLLRAVPLPNFSVTSNSHKIRRMDASLDEVVSGLEKGDNFLFYPAGKVKLSAKEQIGGASGLNKILNDASDYKVVLVRISGLWGSRFSRARGREPMGKTLLWGIKRTLKNLLFFNPRRNVTVEFIPAPADFPYHGTRREQNRYLEDWYNDIGENQEEPLALVPYSAWSRKVDSTDDLIKQDKNEEKQVDLSKISHEIKSKVFFEIGRLTDRAPNTIEPKMELATDLGIDSLDASEIVLFLEENFDAKDVPADELTTVAKILGIAAHQIEYQPEDEKEINLKHWHKAVNKERLFIPDGQTIPEVFLNLCDSKAHLPAVADAVSGVLTYGDVKMRALLLSKLIKDFPGTHIGILLPSSVAAMVTIMACYFAKKIPVMINWTVGPRHVNAVVDCAKLQVAISSWAFLDRLPNVELGNLVDKLVQLEDIKPLLTTKDKLLALWNSKRKAKTVINKLGLSLTKNNDVAVVLFTSGSEGMPKGVPLTHRNILSNVHSITQVTPLLSTDVFYSILPPFHSFGFTVCGITPLIIGVKAAFFPNPTEGAKIASGIKRWGATLICGAPSFLRKIFKSATAEQVKTLRLVVTGAEKATEDLFELVRSFDLDGTLIEGYGITECSPVLTINRPQEERFGVGRAVVHVDIMVVHQETYEKLDINERGLILASGPNVFSGYLNNTEDPFLTIDGKVWYNTGDLGFIDDKGRLSISGRKKRFIKIGPEMVSLEAIEQTLSEESKNRGIATSEEGPAFAVIAKEGLGDRPKIVLFTTLKLSLDQANQLLKSGGFSNLVRLSDAFPVVEIPLMGTGKVNYRKLEEDYLK